MSKEKRLPFSKRNGYVPVVPEFASGILPVNVRTWFWNYLHKAATYGFHGEEWASAGQLYSDFCVKIWCDYLKQRMDLYTPSKYKEVVSNLVLNERVPVHITIDFIEEIFAGRHFQNEAFTILGIEEFKDNLERENAPFRYIDGQVVEINSSHEAYAVEQACECPFAAPQNHIKAALRFLKEDDAAAWRNSIKESIAAVESAFEELVGHRENSVGAYLKAAEKLKLAIELHACFQQGLASFYNWTSSDQGIRHPLDEDARVPTKNDATFMLVVCSAAVNMLLRSKAAARSAK